MKEKLTCDGPTTTEQLSTLTISSNERNKIRFQKHSPLVTLLLMSFGPFITTITTTLMDFVELFLLTKRFPQDSLVKPVQLQGFAGFCNTIVILITTYFSTAVSTRLSRIISENREKDAMHFFSDITKVSLVFLFICLPLIQFLIHPLLSFMNCPEYMENYCYLFTVNFLSAAPFLLLFSIAWSFLQSIGRSILNGILHVVQSIFQVLILTPLFLFVFKIDITLISLQLSLSQSIIGLILFIFIYAGKFGYEADFSAFVRPVLSDTIKALKNSIPSVVSLICLVCPPIFVMKFLLSIAKTPEVAESLAGIHTINGKVGLLANSGMMAVSNGLMTVGTFAYGSGDNVRLLKYFGFAILVTVVFGGVFSIFMIVNPQLIASIYLDSATDMELSNKILKIPYYTNWLSPVGMMCLVLLICVGKPLRASIPSFVQTIIVIFFAFLFSKLYPDNPERIYLAFCINDIIIFMLSSALIAPEIVRLLKKKPQTEDTVTLIDANADF